jgi:hypothetical protein
MEAEEEKEKGKEDRVHQESRQTAAHQRQCILKGQARKEKEGDVAQKQRRLVEWRWVLSQMVSSLDGTGGWAKTI